MLPEIGRAARAVAEERADWTKNSAKLMQVYQQAVQLKDSRRRFLMVFALILALVMAIVVVFFALENPVMVTVSFFGYAAQGSLALIIMVAMGIGVLIGLLIMIPGRIKSSLSNARNRKKIGSLETSLEEHKIKLAAMEKLAESASPPEFETAEGK